MSLGEPLGNDDALRQSILTPTSPPQTDVTKALTPSGRKSSVREMPFGEPIAMPSGEMTWGRVFTILGIGLAGAGVILTGGLLLGGVIAASTGVAIGVGTTLVVGGAVGGSVGVRVVWHQGRQVTVHPASQDPKTHSVAERSGIKPNVVVQDELDKDRDATQAVLDAAMKADADANVAVNAGSIKDIDAAAREMKQKAAESRPPTPTPAPAATAAAAAVNPPQQKPLIIPHRLQECSTALGGTQTAQNAINTINVEIKLLNKLYDAWAYAPDSAILDKNRKEWEKRYEGVLILLENENLNQVDNAEAMQAYVASFKQAAKGTPDNADAAAKAASDIKLNAAGAQQHPPLPAAAATAASAPPSPQKPSSLPIPHFTNVVNVSKEWGYTTGRIDAAVDSLNEYYDMFSNPSKHASTVEFQQVIKLGAKNGWDANYTAILALIKLLESEPLSPSEKAAIAAYKATLEKVAKEVSAG